MAKVIEKTKCYDCGKEIECRVDPESEDAWMTREFLICLDCMEIREPGAKELYNRLDKDEQDTLRLEGFLLA